MLLYASVKTLRCYCASSLEKRGFEPAGPNFNGLFNATFHSCSTSDHFSCSTSLSTSSSLCRGSFHVAKDKAFASPVFRYIKGRRGFLFGEVSSLESGPPSCCPTARFDGGSPLVWFFSSQSTLPASWCMATRAGLKHCSVAPRRHSEYQQSRPRQRFFFEVVLPFQSITEDDLHLSNTTKCLALQLYIAKGRRHGHCQRLASGSNFTTALSRLSANPDAVSLYAHQTAYSTIPREDHLCLSTRRRVRMQICFSVQRAASLAELNSLSKASNDLRRSLASLHERDLLEFIPSL
jgi:hypothetical protein